MGQHEMGRTWNGTDMKWDRRAWNGMDMKWVNMKWSDMKCRAWNGGDPETWNRTSTDDQYLCTVKTDQQAKLFFLTGLSLNFFYSITFFTGRKCYKREVWLILLLLPPCWAFFATFSIIPTWWPTRVDMISRWPKKVDVILCWWSHLIFN